MFWVWGSRELCGLLTWSLERLREVAAPAPSPEPGSLAAKRAPPALCRCAWPGAHSSQGRSPLGLGPTCPVSSAYRAHAGISVPDCGVRAAWCPALCLVCSGSGGELRAAGPSAGVRPPRPDNATLAPLPPWGQAGRPLPMSPQRSPQCSPRGLASPQHVFSGFVCIVACGRLAPHEAGPPVRLATPSAPRLPGALVPR